MLTSLISLSLPSLSYTHPLVWGQLLCALLLFICAGGVAIWRRRFAQSIARKLSRSWSLLLAVYGVVALVLGVSRAEGIPFFSMPLLVILWLVLLLFTIILHRLLFVRRYYTIVPTVRVEDPRDRYLPHKR